MKRGTIIDIAFGTYLVSMIAMFIGVQQYVHFKDNRLYAEIHEKIDSIFANQQQYVDIAYSGYKVGYEKVPIPARPGRLGIQDIDRKTMDTWKANYGDLSKMYRTHYKRSDCAGPFDYEDGWNLCVLEHDYEGVYQTWIFPYAVGYLKQEYDFGYLPSIASAVNGALEFYTTNNKSTYYKSFEQGCVNKVWSKIYDAQNEYYSISEDEIPRFNRSGSPLFEQYPKDNKYHAYQNGYMYNGFYKVFIASTQPETWTITKKAWAPDEQDKKDLSLYWAIGLTILLLLVVIPLCIIDAKHQKVKDESLYDKLKRMCNPANFMDGSNYDKDKVDKANEIYKKLLEIKAEDTEVLNELQQQAVANLGINLINAEKLSDLKEKVNPKNYMTPYNPDKVALANELFAILNKEGLTYNEMADVEEKAKTL